MPVPGYINCELRLHSSQSASIKIFDDTGGEPANYSDRPVKCQNLLPQLATLDDAKAYGKLLFQSLFTTESDLLTGYRVALFQAQQAKKTLRFLLSLSDEAAQELLSINWEWLYDPQLGAFLSRSPAISFSRRLGDKPLAEPVANNTPRALVVVSNPKDLKEYEKLNLAALSRQQLEGIFRQALPNNGPGLAYEFLQDEATPQNILERLNTGKYQILHIHAHGVLLNNGQVNLVLENAAGETAFLDEDFFSELFQGDPSAYGVRLVLLMACHGGVSTKQGEPFSGLGLKLVEKGCPSVVLLGDAISVNAGDIFTKYFYGNLVASQGQVDVACNRARQLLAMATQESPFVEWGLPTLYNNAKNGLLWQPAANGNGNGNSAASVNDPAAPASGQLVPSLLLEHLRREDGGVIPIIGPELTRGWLLSDKELANLLADKVALYKNRPALAERYKLSRVAKAIELDDGYDRDLVVKTLCGFQKEFVLQRLKVEDRKQKQNLPLDALLKAFAFQSAADTTPYSVLAQLPISYYLTTNHDNLLYQTLAQTKEAKLRELNGVQRESCHWHEAAQETMAYKTLRGTRDNPLVFHLYGQYEDPDSLVLTEDDYFDFLSNVQQESWRVPEPLRQSLTLSTLLIIGFDIRKLDFRVLFKAIIDRLKPMVKSAQLPKFRRAVIQIEDEADMENEAFRRFMEQVSGLISVTPIFGTARDFLLELRDKHNNGG